ncbi:hypothetical protein ACI6PO_00615 [Agrobacterium tumefaciens]
MITKTRRAFRVESTQLKFLLATKKGIIGLSERRRQDLLCVLIWCGHSLKEIEFLEAVKGERRPDNTERKQSASNVLMGLIKSICLGCELPASTDELAQREIGQQSGSGLFFFASTVNGCWRRKPEET